MRSKLSIITILALALILTACGSGTTSQAAGPNMNITGTGIVYITPDIAYITIGVHTENKEVSPAVAANNAQAQGVIDALKAGGVDPKDIQTSNFSIYTTQSYDKLTGIAGGTLYAVDNTVQVTVRDLGKMPALLDAVVASGANTINGISFDVADKTAALKQARQLAMDNAKILAAELAADAGVKLGDIQNVAYTDYQSSPYSPYYGKGGGGMMAEAAPMVSINPGQLQLTVSVNLVYSITH
jgi:uncharacterized protein